MCCNYSQEILSNALSDYIKWEDIVWCCRVIDTLHVNVRPVVSKWHFVSCYGWKPNSFNLLWENNREIIAMPVNYWPYWNQSYWNGSMTVGPVHEGCWCSLHVNERGLTDASCEVRVSMWAVCFLGFGEGTRGPVFIETPLSGIHFCLSVFSGTFS